jgi:hypothetical protein
MKAWKDAIFGIEATHPISHHGVFPESKYAAFRKGGSFLFARAGEVGMGGDGSSSHAHDDFLSPIAWLAGLPVIVDPGTFIYNGKPKRRAQYRDWEAHNAFAIDNKTVAEQKFNFGWTRVRPPAIIERETATENSVGFVGKFGEWPLITREITIAEPAAAAVASLEILDMFEKDQEPYRICEWHLHFHPRWKHKVMPPKIEASLFEDSEGNMIIIDHGGAFDTTTVETYDYSPMYGVSQRAHLFRAYCHEPIGLVHIRVALFTADYDTEEALNEVIGTSR